MKLLMIIGLGGVVFAVCWLIQTAASLAGIPLNLAARSGPGQVTLYLVGLVCVYLFTRYVWKRSTAAPFRLYWDNRRVALRGFVFFYGVAAVSAAALYAACLAAGTVEWSDDILTRLTPSNGIRIVAAFAATVVLASSEELIFRGFGFRFLLGGGGRLATAAALAGSALLFAAVHNFRDPLAWFTPAGLSLLLGLALLGVVLAYAYLVTGSLACSVGLHGGLLGVHDVILQRTDAVSLVQTTWWMGVGDDIRTAPIAWLFLVLIAVFFWRFGSRLRRRFEIESVIPDPRRTAAAR